MLTAEQQRIRRSGITGTDIAAIVGLSPFRSALDVWCEKVLGVTQDETLAMEVGTALEPVILREYARRCGVTLLPGQTLRHKEHPLVVATPDAIHPDGYPVEAKASESFTAYQDWGADGTDEVPEWYRTQSTWQQAVLGAGHGDLIAMLGRRDVRLYRVPFDPDYFGVLLEAAEKFHREHIATEKPPEPDGSEAWGNWLKQRFPRAIDPLSIPATEEHEEWMKRYDEARSMMSHWEKVKEMAKQNLANAIGVGTGLIGVWGKATWANVKGSLETDWKGLAAELGATEALIEKYTLPKAGHRQLRVTAAKTKRAEGKTGSESWTQ